MTIINMKCSGCHKPLIKGPGEITVCPLCAAANLNHNSKKTTHHKQSLLLKNIKKSKQKLVFGFVLALVVVTALSMFSLVKKPSKSPHAAAVVKTNQWDSVKATITEAEQLIAAEKYDEALALLGKIDNNYPDYAQVLKLLGVIEAHKAAVAAKVTPVPPKVVAKTEPVKPTIPKTTPALTSKTVEPEDFTTTIQIKGDATCKSATTDALKLLSEKAPAHYAVVRTYIGVIECAAQGSGMFAYEIPTRYVVGDATRNAGTIWYAGTIAHDAGHSQMYHVYLNAHPGVDVPNDVWTGEAAERLCLDAQHDALTKIGATQLQLDYVANVIDTQYYNVTYENRWW